MHPLSVTMFITCLLQSDIQPSANKNEGIEVFKGKEGASARVEDARYRLIGMKAMEPLPKEGLDKLQGVLKRLRPWTAPKHIPPPSLPAFEEQIAASVLISGRRVKLKLSVSTGRELILDELNSFVWEVPDEQRDILRQILKAGTKKGGRGRP